MKISSNRLFVLAVIAGLALAGIYAFGLQTISAAPVEVYSNISAPSNGTSNSLTSPSLPRSG